jgi:hypothetical protein
LSDVETQYIASPRRFCRLQIDAIDDPIGDTIDDPIDDPIGDPIDDPIGDTIDDTIDDPIDDTIDNSHNNAIIFRARARHALPLQIDVLDLANVGTRQGMRHYKPFCSILKFCKF